MRSTCGAGQDGLG
ncbi:hypothetical protein STRIP9103_04319, partial [Streptomyces ipomoeae 91-03]